MWCFRPVKLYQVFCLRETKKYFLSDNDPNLIGGNSSSESAESTKSKFATGDLESRTAGILKRCRE